ncbi:hypothetical protein GRI44_13225 [Altererythrobacter confluentis]|uniref:Uncharacterized protein n=1 Tax=Allopontixanthobacter confluentis TaxID=1849021 RepID=A0A6L7GM44_9SPHN|nr:hypothetical protein [Allopontixanthobacter confluentis]MXP15711.1 hypothetical protein [Allopontixanthobacter confluentis]
MGALLLAACQSVPENARPITIAREAFAGEALYRGSLELVDGCIVAAGHRRAFTALFDPRVVRTASGEGIFEPPTGNTIRFGHPMQGGGGNLRENGKGRTISDIERFYEVSIPSGCPRNNVMRLRNMEEVAG